jgi:hypothetical protein
MTAVNLHAAIKNHPLARARLALSNSKIPAIRALNVEADSSGVELRGRVNLYYYKQLAQELVRNEIDDTPIINRIDVVDPTA